MHPAAKMVIGIILVLIGFWLLIPSAWIAAIKPIAWFDWWNPFVTMVKGVIPPMLILLGILVVWIEWEELKMSMSEKKK